MNSWVWAPYACFAFRARSGHPVPWNLSYLSMWVLGTDSGSLARASSILNYCAVSSVLCEWLSFDAHRFLIFVKSNLSIFLCWAAYFWYSSYKPIIQATIIKIYLIVLLRILLIYSLFCKFIDPFQPFLLNRGLR